jgi:hypothetical protein
MRGTTMKADDPRLEAKRKELFERIEKMDDLLLTIVKNHICLKQFMSDFLDTCREDPEDLSFFQKIEACEEHSPEEIEAATWRVFYAANELRNKIAHTYDEAKVKQKLAALRTAYIAVQNSPAQVEAVKKLTDAQLAAGAMQLCGAYLVVATERVKAARR